GSTEAGRAREVPASMQVGMLVLVGMCVALGLTPFLVVPVLSRALTGLGRLPMTPIGFSLHLPLSVAGVTGEMSPLLLAVGVALLGEQSEHDGRQHAQEGHTDGEQARRDHPGQPRARSAALYVCR